MVKTGPMNRFHFSCFAAALCVAVFSVSVSAQTKTVVVGEDVRRAMYLSAYIA